MRVDLKGIHTVRKRLADGRVRTYRYAWRGGPALPDTDDQAELLLAYAEARRQARERAGDTLGRLLCAYRASPEFERLGERTRADYLRQIKRIEAEFGDMPLAALDDPRVRQDFRRWRDSMRETPKQADYAVTVLRLVLSWALAAGMIASNPASGIGHLYSPDRSDCVWRPEHVARFEAVAGPEMRLALVLAMETGQRQGDLLRLPWSACEGGTITLRQGKRGRRVTVPVTARLRPILAAAPRRGPLVLTDAKGRPWSGPAFRNAWGAASRAAGLDKALAGHDRRGNEIIGLRFSDLRGTAITALAEAGCTVPEIAAITGHGIARTQAIIDTYLARRDLSAGAVRRLDAHRAREAL